MKVIKRNKTVKEFDRYFITRAIEGAMRETMKGVNVELSDVLTGKAVDSLVAKFGENATIEVEAIQDAVLDVIFKEGLQELYNKYFFYRESKLLKKNAKADALRPLTDDFISRFKHLESPLEELGNFVYYRTYSRYLPEKGRREYWWETVRRAVEYNVSLVPQTSRKEAEELFENIFFLRQFLSGRTFWVGNSPVSKDYPMGNFNCAFKVADSIQIFGDVFYLLMVGSGVGFRILKSDVVKVPKMRANIDLRHEYVAKKAKERQDKTSLSFNNETAEIIVGDSKEGWTQAIKHYFDIVTGHDYKEIERIIINYSNVRPKGEKLKRFGGTASGHESLKTMFIKMDNVIKRRAEEKQTNTAKLRPIDMLDILNIIAENVVSGGVRRSSEIALIDPTDEECINAKSEIYTNVNGEWKVNKDLLHRQMSNNSIFYEEKPTRERLAWQLNKMRYSGEPGWVYAGEGRRRFADMQGVNPCGEILLDTNGMCNLTTINVFAFVDANGNLDVAGLLNAQRLSVRAGYRLTEVDMELHHWNLTLQKHKIVGASLTGWQDMVNATGMSKEEEAELLKQLRQTAHEEGAKYASELGKAMPILVTTVKPEGTLSQLPTVSSGVHYSHSPYYIRRIRVSANDPILKVAQELEWSIFPEVGQSIETATTMVVEFPVKAPKGRTKYDVSAIEQLENYKMFMQNYVDHNASITVHVRDHEWQEVEQWVWDNWEHQIGLSFLSLDDSFYELLPYEAIEEEEYLRRKASMAKFIPSMISKYEVEYKEEEEVGSDCASGMCPIR